MPSPTDTIIFSMASRITAQFPNITVSDAMTLATIALDEFTSHSTPSQRTSKATKPKDPTKPKRTKNAFMFYLDNVRPALKAQLLAEAQAEDPAVTTIRVSKVTTLAGAKWRELDDATKAPFQKMADDAKDAAIAAVSTTVAAPAPTLAADSKLVLAAAPSPTTTTSPVPATVDAPTPAASTTSIAAPPPAAPITA